MRCSPCHLIIENPGEDELYSKKLQRKEIKLKKKEKELMKKSRALQRKISKYKRQKSDKVKADLRAAAKLQQAKRKLLFVLNTKDTTKKQNSHCNKKHKMNAHTKSRKKSKLAESSQLNLFHYFNDLIHRPCKFTGQGSKKRFTIEPDSCSLYLQRLFGRPCSCKNEYNTRISRPIFRHCKCEEAARGPKLSYWEKAAGDCYLMSLRRPPLFYPPHFDMKRQCKNCGYIMLFLAGILIWTPCLLCIELCKCCFCACCTDC